MGYVTCAGLSVAQGVRVARLLGRVTAIESTTFRPSKEGRKEGRKEVSKSVFYAQSTSAVISGRQTEERVKTLTCPMKIKTRRKVQKNAID